MSFPEIDRVYEDEPYVSGLVYLDPYLYVLYWGGWPAYEPKVHQLNPDTYEKISEWTAPYAAAFTQSICTDCEYIYVGTSNRGPTGGHHPIHVYKIDPDTMSTVASWAGQATGDVWAEAIQFDFESECLLVLEDRGPYRIYKLDQNLNELMRKTAESSWPPFQWYGADITILGDYFYVATGGTPGQIVKRRISDLEMVDWFTGYTNDPDDYIEGIFFNICNDGQYLYTATYDYSEYRPARLIKVNPSDMTRAGTYYGTSDEICAYGSYAYGGKIYMLLCGWDGVFHPNEQKGEHVLQIDPDGMICTQSYMDWSLEQNDAYRAVGDGSRLHVAFWGWEDVNRNVLQFAEEGVPGCMPWVGNKVILSNSKDKYFVEKIRPTGIGDVGMLLNIPSQKCFLPKVSIKVGDACKVLSFKDRYFARKL